MSIPRSQVLDGWSQGLDRAADPSDTQYYAYVYGGVQSCIEVKFCGNVTQKEFSRCILKNALAEDFYQSIPQLFGNSKIKAILIEPILNQKEEKDEYEFVKAAKHRLDAIKHNVKYFFIGIEASNISMLLNAANISVQPGEFVFTNIFNPKRNTFLLNELQFSEDGYKRIAIRRVDPNDKCLSKNANRKHILGSNVTSKIIMQADKPGIQAMRILRDKLLAEECQNHVIIEEPRINFLIPYIINTCKWILDKSFTKFHVIPKSTDLYLLGYKFGGSYVRMIETVKDQYLPFSKAVIIPRSYFQCFFGNALTIVGGIQELEVFDLPEKSHEQQISLAIDIHGIHTFEAVPIINDKIAGFPEFLDKSSAPKTSPPVIGIFNDITVICINKDGGGYQFMDSWNGMYGKDLYISFDKEKPEFFEDAVKVYKAKQSRVVHNLLKLISMPFEEMKKELFPEAMLFDRVKMPGAPLAETLVVERYSIKKFVARMPFKILSAENGETLIQYENFDGRPKTVTPLLLMAMLLKEHIKAIKDEIGESPSEIGFCIFGDFDDIGKKRIEKCFEDCCKLCRIDCFFVNQNA